MKYIINDICSSIYEIYACSSIYQWRSAEERINFQQKIWTSIGGSSTIGWDAGHAPIVDFISEEARQKAGIVFCVAGASTQECWVQQNLPREQKTSMDDDDDNDDDNDDNDDDDDDISPGNKDIDNDKGQC